MDDDGWNRSLYVSWTVKTWQISDFKLQRITMYSPIRITRDLFKYPNPRNYFCYRLFPVKRNCDELELIACNVKWTVIFRPRVSYLVQSILVQTSQISHFIISFFSIQKTNFIFLFGCGKFCSGSWWIIFGESRNVNESSSELTLGQNLGSEIKSEINEIRKCIWRQH